MWGDSISKQGDTRPRAERPLANFRFVSEHYFESMGVALRQGRFLSSHNRSHKVVAYIGKSSHVLWRPRIRSLYLQRHGHAYKTYLNIGIWKDLQSFDEAVGKYIQPPERRKPLSGPYQDSEMLAVYRQDFEFKIRERVILQVIMDRKGALELPETDLT
jgi:hypothetical protein